MDRITAMRVSLAGFVCGLVGLLPVAGMLPAVHALRNWRRVRRHYPGWNPASRYLEWGALLGLLGLLISVLTICGIAAAKVASMLN